MKNEILFLRDGLTLFFEWLNSYFLQFNVEKSGIKSVTRAKWHCNQRIITIHAPGKVNNFLKHAKNIDLSDQMSVNYGRLFCNNNNNNNKSK